MDGTLSERLRKREQFGLLYVANFIFAFHLFLVIYLHSSFLGTFIDQRFVGTVWIIGSLAGIAGLLAAPTFLRRLGNYRLSTLLAGFEMLIFVGLALAHDPLSALVLFVLFLATYPLILFNLDIFLESYTSEEGTTGGVRGIFLTVANVALVMAPFTVGFIIADSDYSRAYLVSAAFLIPFLVLLTRFRSFQDPKYYTLHIAESLRGVWSNRNIYSVFMAQFILRLFYAAMVIYLPVYLHDHIGFSWNTFGTMAAIILLPYLLFELPAGKIADTWIGEKEMLIAGFIITALSTAAIPFITTNSFFLWTAVLFATRTGASLVEIMTESYFFKHVRGENDDVIGLFRILNPLAYVAGPLAASLIFFIFNIETIFFFTALILLYGVRYALAITDTK